MNELAIELKMGSEKCLYEQIYEYIKEEIRKGKLLAGERLPSTRSLAEYLQVSRSTAQFAYEQLVSEGYIESRPYKGYFICKIEELYDLQAKEPVKEKKEQETKKYSYRFDFSPHAISMQEFPFATWKKITKNILVDANSELFALGEPQGDLQLRNTISRYLYASRGVNCKAEQIIIGAGNDYLLMLLEKILGEGKPVAMESPSYKRAFQIFSRAGYPVSLIPMDESGILVSELYESNSQIAYVMPSHQYPTGTVMPIGRRMELLKWAAEKEEHYLIEDDYDSEFRYRGKPIPALQASDRADKVIYMGTFSKSIAPAIRVSYMVLPESLLQTYRKQCYFYSSTVSRIDQQILNEFIAEGYFERYLNKMRKIYKEKHDLLMEELEDFKENFEISGEHAGLHILLTARKEKCSEQWLLETARGTGVKVYGLSETYLGSKQLNHLKPTVMLGFAALSLEDIVEGIHLLKQVWI